MSATANNKSDSDEFDEEDGDETAAEDAESLDVDHLIKSLDRLKRRGTGGGARVADPAWRRLERYREDRHTEEMMSDFDDYDLGPGDPGPDGGNGEASAARPIRKKRKH